jgi:hypothetical protein
VKLNKSKESKHPQSAVEIVIEAKSSESSSGFFMLRKCA